jgi:hypothetical protein
MRNKNLIGLFVFFSLLLVMVGGVFSFEYDEELNEKEFWKQNPDEIIEEWDSNPKVAEAWDGLEGSERKEIYDSLESDDQRTKLFNKWDKEKRDSYMKDITGGKDFGGLADAQNAKIENGLLTFDKVSGARHKIPVDHIPQKVKSYKFGRNYNGPENEHGVFTKLEDGNIFYSDNGIYVQEENGKLVAKDYTYTGSNGIPNPVESVELNFGKNEVIRIGSAGGLYKNGIGMWGNDVSVKIGNRVFSPNINGPVPKGDVFNRPYGHVNIVEESVFRVTGNYQTYSNDEKRIISGVMYGTEEGVVAFKKLEDPDLIRIKKSVPNAKVVSFYDQEGVKQISGNAFGHTAFDISEGTEVNLHVGKGEGYEIVDFKGEDERTFLRAVKSEEGVISGDYEKLENGHYVRRTGEAEHLTKEGTKRIIGSGDASGGSDGAEVEASDTGSGATTTAKEAGGGSGADKVIDRIQNTVSQTSNPISEQQIKQFYPDSFKDIKDGENKLKDIHTGKMNNNPVKVFRHTEIPFKDYVKSYAMYVNDKKVEIKSMRRIRGFDKNGHNTYILYLDSNNVERYYKY